MKLNLILTLLAVFLAGTVCLTAQTYLNVKLSGGDTRNAALTTINKITFGSGGTQITYHLSDKSGFTSRLDSVQNFTFGSYATGGPLPVELTAFSAQRSGKDILLTWSTATEINSFAFEVQKLHSETWQTLGKVWAAGNSNSAKNYTFLDKNLPAGKHSYRLKMIDNDGSFDYSATVFTETLAPREFTVDQNYPNPFNPSTVIAYHLPAGGQVKATVYNVQGEVVKELFEGRQEAGSYQVVWDGKNTVGTVASNGMYICRIEFNTRAINKKMLLLK